MVDRIATAATSHNRAVDDLTVVVVTKNNPHQLVLDLLNLGSRDFGENRDQEAAPKAKQIALESDKSFNWHFIGQLQTNKVKSVLEYAHFLHSLDRSSLLDELKKRTIDREVPLRVFVQVNLTDDPERGGVAASDLMAFSERVLDSPGLELVGLMGVGGLAVAPEGEFEKLAILSQEIQKLAPSAAGLSMGMSGDFETAIAYGATHLRIGTAITGNRPN
ncbi:MAG: YggS family pyridoxal phosphate-dependent enzyme [Actinobacteria bacterium]|nr:YggS family pyridoxal phosphate-dependent enzyme [Actinomycetota bacterium]